MSNATQPVQGVDYAAIAGDPKHVRCILRDAKGVVCGAILPSRKTHATRLKRHYSHKGAFNAEDGRGAKVKKCRCIAPEQQADMSENDVIKDKFIELPSGYERFVHQRARPFLRYFSHDKDGHQTLCMYCGEQMLYNPDNLLAHLIEGSDTTVPCAEFPDELREELLAHASKKTARVDQAVRNVVQSMVKEGATKQAIQTWYFAPATRTLIARLTALPAVKDYGPPSLKDVMS